MNLSLQLFMSIAEHFRAAALPNQRSGWRDNLPAVPRALEEQFLRDEQRVLVQLARRGSASAQIITDLLLTWCVVEAALHQLRDARRAQCNLLDILSATRLRPVLKMAFWTRTARSGQAGPLIPSLI